MVVLIVDHVFQPSLIIPLMLDRPSYLTGLLNAVIYPDCPLPPRSCNLEAALEAPDEGFVDGLHATVISDGVLRDAVAIQSCLCDLGVLIDTEMPSEQTLGHFNGLIFTWKLIRLPACPPMTAHHDRDFGAGRRVLTLSMLLLEIFQQLFKTMAYFLNTTIIFVVDVAVLCVIVYTSGVTLVVLLSLL